MSRYSLTQLSDAALVHALATVISDEGACIARVLAHIAEFDARRLCRAAGYSSTFAYEKRTCAATTRPRRARETRSTRHVPASVRRAVWRRDGGRCTFVGDSGHRCESRDRLELDHVVPVARGGESTVDNLRLLCRAHNQLEGERVFGEAFMASRREGAGSARASA
jgi:5-methylcytosine-specific restriction endonuclease McrA